MSEKKNDGGPAFPVVAHSGTHFTQGMTLRDYYKGKALIGVLSIESLQKTFFIGGVDYTAIANLCGELADAMLKERDK